LEQRDQAIDALVAHDAGELVAPARQLADGAVEIDVDDLPAPRRLPQQIVERDRLVLLEHDPRLDHGAEPGLVAVAADLELLAAIAGEFAGIGGDREAAEELDHLLALGRAHLAPAGADDEARHLLEIEGR